MKSAGVGAVLGMLALAAGCGARTDPNVADDSSLQSTASAPAHTRGVEQVCSVVLAQSCSEQRSLADCYALFDRNRSDAVTRGCGDVYDALLACWAAHGASCSPIGAVWNDGCEAAERAFDLCTSN